MIESTHGGHHSDILEGRVRPIIVAGLPRTGTSWLFELLALDPDARAPLEWEAAAPWPAPEAETFDSDPRIAATQAGYDAMLNAAPELATMHEFGALLPAECNSMMQLHFASSNFWASYAVPDYIQWPVIAPSVVSTHISACSNNCSGKAHAVAGPSNLHRIC